MSIEKGVDSYVTIAEADAYIQERFDIETWDTADTTTREKALKLATRHIDSEDYRFVKYDVDQDLKFPRNVYMYYAQQNDYSEVPTPVLEATAVEALAILDDRENDSYIESLLAQGIQSQKIEGTSFSFADGAVQANRYESDIISKEARKLLDPWIIKSYRRS